MYDGEEMGLSCDDTVKDNLIKHMGMVHKMVVGATEDYWNQMRRRVYHTPKSFLAFLGDYKGVDKETGNFM